MFRYLGWNFLLILALNSHAQSVTLQTNYSRPFATFQFLNSLSARSPKNVYKQLFEASRFSTQEYLSMINAFDSLHIDYDYDFTDYPPGQKVGIEVDMMLRRNLILCDSLYDFKIRSLGLVPKEKLFRLIQLIQAFAPVYDTVIYQPSQTKFTEQLGAISELIKTSNINYYFTEALNFYQSSWDHSIPFVFSFYPLPHSIGFTATAVSNVAISAIADSLENYNALLSVMLHEMCHVLYDERSLKLWKDLENWFDSNPSKSSRYANSLFNEAMATAVANGYMAAQLNGKEDTTRRWYGVKYISMMAKAAYPAVKEYIQSRKPINKDFIDRYIQQFDEHFSIWLFDPQFLMRGRLLVSEKETDADLVSRLYQSAPGNTDYHEISETQLKKTTENLGTKLIIVNRDNTAQLKLIKNYFNELAAWDPNSKQDFVRSFFLNNKTWLIIINNVKGTSADKLKGLVVRQTQ